MNAADNLQDNIVWHTTTVGRSDREARLGQRGTVVWLTGLSGCGKSTIANELEALLHRQGRASILLDGDNVRHGLCAPPQALQAEHDAEFAKRFGLGFGPQDRQENIRRIAAVGQLFVSAGMIAITAFVSPYRGDRQRARQWVESQGQPGDFVEVFVDTPLEICEQRDPKGLYRKARAGQIHDFTGISSPYEPPTDCELRLPGGDGRTPSQLAQQIADHLQAQGRWLPPNGAE